MQWTVKELEHDGDFVNLILWDVAGQEKFREVRASFYDGSNAVIIVFDVTNPVSFEHVENWYSEVQRYCREIPYIILANKIDLVDQRQVTPEMVHPLVQKLNLPYFETSAKTGENVMDMFHAAITQIKNSQVPYQSPIQNPTIDLKEDIIDLADKFLILEELVQNNESVSVISTEFKMLTNEIFKENPYHRDLEEMTRWRIERLNSYPMNAYLSTVDSTDFLRWIQAWKNSLTGQ